MAIPQPFIATDTELTYSTGTIDTNVHGMVFVRTGDRIYTNIRTTGYQWNSSVGGINEWYLSASGGGIPNLPSGENRFFYHVGSYITPTGLIGSFAEGEWGYGNNDGLAYNTLYTRTFATGFGEAPHNITNPDNETDGSFWTSVDNSGFSWGNSTPNTLREIYWDFTDASGTQRRYGFNASHKFASTGSVLLSITDLDGQSATVIRPVNKITWSPTIYYISGSGNDLNDGLSLSTEKRSLDSAVTAAGVNSDIRFLLRRNETYTSSTPIIFLNPRIEINAYGTGLRPVLDTNSELDFREDDVLIENIKIGKSAGPTQTTPIRSLKNNSIKLNRFTLRDIEPFGFIGSFISLDRLHNGLHLENVICGDLSASSGFGSYFMYRAKRTKFGSGDTLNARIPLAMQSIYNCSNNYGSKVEVVIRVAGDYMAFNNCSWEQTHSSGVTQFYKAAGPRIVGGSHVYSKNDTFAFNCDTTVTNPGFGGFTWAPADGQSYSSRWVVIEDGNFIGTVVNVGIRSAEWLNAFCDDVTVKRCVTTFPFPKLFYDAVSIDLQNAAFCRRWKIVNNTYVANTGDLCRVWDLIGSSGKNYIQDWTIQNNLIVNPALRIFNNDTNVAGMIFARTSTSGISEFSSIKDNVYADPDLGAGDYPSGFVVRFTNINNNTNTAKLPMSWLNQQSFGNNNKLFDSIIDNNNQLTDTTSIGGTNATEVLGYVYNDKYGNLFTIGGPVGAFAFPFIPDIPTYYPIQVGSEWLILGV